ncbi:MAG: tRNA glutamyl-Q(34) synthetase GluQRS [Deltaproteobacteria bacterium]|nr:tRNA glutamyl-Q(34) synthetase GluQRS [Deltaproteobacteria bacterium]
MSIPPPVPTPVSPAVVGRLAPSPTGLMHLGNARTALLAWLSARSQGGRILLRIEDIDTPRVAPGGTRALQEDLAALGLICDEMDAGSPCLQSQRRHLYDDALTALARQQQTFLCSCSRADLMRAPSAPHAADEGPRYPGTCRDKAWPQVLQEAKQAGKSAAVRFRGGQNVRFVDGLLGEHEQLVDDFVLRRADGLHAYQLAVVVDDGLMGVTEVVRGDDLLSSTGRQVALARCLGFAPPAHIHVPLVLSPAGERLAKRNRPPTVRDVFARGVAAETLIGAMAASAGLCPPGTRTTANELVADFAWTKVRRTPVVIDPITLQSYQA